MFSLLNRAAKQPVRCILVCQNVTCKRQNSAAILAAFENALAAADCPVESLDSQEAAVSVVASGCLGQCGNGPMVIFLPGPIWYANVQLDMVDELVSQHVLRGRPVTGWRYWPDGEAPNSLIPWLVGLALFMLFCVGIAVWAGQRAMAY